MEPSASQSSSWPEFPPQGSARISDEQGTECHHLKGPGADAVLPEGISMPHVWIESNPANPRPILHQFVKPKTFARRLIQQNPHLTLSADHVRAAYLSAVERSRSHVDLTNLWSQGLTGEDVQARSALEMQQIIARVYENRPLSKDEQLADIRAKIARTSSKKTVTRLLKQEQRLSRTRMSAETLTSYGCKKESKRAAGGLASGPASLDVKLAAASQVYAENASDQSTAAHRDARPVDYGEAATDAEQMDVHSVVGSDDSGNTHLLPPAGGWFPLSHVEADAWLDAYFGPMPATMQPAGKGRPEFDFLTYTIEYLSAMKMERDGC